MWLLCKYDNIASIQPKTCQSVNAVGCNATCFVGTLPCLINFGLVNKTKEENKTNKSKPTTHMETKQKGTEQKRREGLSDVCH